MAIHPLLPGLSVTVCVNNYPLPEHPDNEPVIPPLARYSLSKYIESTSEQAFAIRATLDPSFQADCPTLAFWFYVDGIEVERKAAFFGLDGKLLGGKGEMEWSRLVQGARVCKEGVKTFQFMGIGIASDDDDNALDSVPQHQQKLIKVGTIEVKVFRKSKAEKKDDETMLFNVDLNTPAEVHEKSLKGQAKSHGTSFGGMIPASLQKLSRSEFLDGKDAPLAVFAFKYRSRESLKQLLIIERTPEPSSDEVSYGKMPSKGEGGRSASDAMEVDIERVSPDAGDEAIDLAPRDEEERRQLEDFVRRLRNQRAKQQSNGTGIQTKRERDVKDIPTRRRGF